MKDKYFVTFCHDVQIEWYTAFAESLKQYSDINSVCIVQGSEDKERAIDTNVYSHVIDILDSFDYTKANKDFESNLHSLKEWEDKITESNFFKDVAQDRWLNKKYSYEYIVHYGVHIIKELNEIFSMYPPLVMVGEKNALQYRITHHYSKILGFPQFTLLGARHFAANRFYFEPDIYWRWYKIRHFYDQFRKAGIPEIYLNKAKEKLEQITVKHFNAEKKKVKRGQEGLLKKLNLNLIGNFFTGWRRNLKRNKYVNPRVVIVEDPVERIKLFIQKRKSQTEFEKLSNSNVDLERKFVTYFLHLQPEYTIDGLGFGVNNQVELIRMVSASLPADHVLYVKEHTVAVGQRPPNFYQDIVKTPNVRLISDQVDGHQLIKKAKIVFSITGTVALEASYHGVPAILFGEIFHTHFEGITQIKSSWDELNAKVKEILSNPSEFVSDQYNALCIISAMLAASHPGCVSPVFIDSGSIHKSPNKELLGKALVQELKYLHILLEKEYA